jgi:hypothetical protein
VQKEFIQKVRNLRENVKLGIPLSQEDLEYLEEFNAELDFLLIRQKDIVLRTIAARKIEQAKAMLKIVDELWNKFDYAYKIEELSQRIKDDKRSL